MIQRRFRVRLDRSRSYLEGVATALNEKIKNKEWSPFGHLVNAMFHKYKTSQHGAKRISTYDVRLRNAETTNKYRAVLHRRDRGGACKIILLST
ncbi:MAG TPA: hypothetical protein VMF32_12815 [Xanthobacteraceae bacterium]|nr:hypothetical protein [Xanthobacteraceae bacterium]